MNKETIFYTIKTAQEAYDAGDPIMSDEEFDVLFESAKTNYPDHEYFEKLHVVTPQSKIKLSQPMGSLNQYKTWDKISTFMKREVVVTDKLDGVSAEMIYVNGVLKSARTRGDGYYGSDITHIAQNMKNVKQTILTNNSYIRVRGELIVKKDVSVVGYATQRSYVSGNINSLESSTYFNRNAEFIVFDITCSDLDNVSKLQALNTAKQLYGFNVVKRRAFATGEINSIDSLLDIFKHAKDNSAYVLDGLVIEYNDKKLRVETDDLNPQYAFKFKQNLAGSSKQSRVVDVIWTESKDGYLKPRVQVEPTEFDGVIVQFATGFNAAYIKSNNIGPDSIVELVLSGGVIPHITGVVHETQPLLPDFPYYWSKTKVDIIAETLSETSKLKRITNFCATIGVPGLGGGSIKKLVQTYSIEDINDFLDLDDDQFRETMGPNAGQKAYDNLHNALDGVNEIVLAKALDICGRGNGTSKFEAIVDKFGSLFSNKINESTLAEVKGISELSAHQIYHGLLEVADFIEQNEIKTTIDVKIPVNENAKSYCFTGGRNKELENKLIETGNIIETGVKAGLTYLVVKDLNKTSNKTKKAKELDIEILSLQDLVKEVLG